MHAHHSATVREQLVGILKVQQKIDRLAAANGLSQPTIFAGMAVYFQVRPEHFRPGCERLSNDIDFLIDAEDVSSWQTLLDLQLTAKNSEVFQGLGLKGRMDSVEIDMLAKASNRFPAYDPQYVFHLDRTRTPCIRHSFAGHSLRLMAPAELVCFKLLLGREKSSGKYDFEDAAALLADTQISADDLFSVFARGIIFSDRHKAFIRARLMRCAELTRELTESKIAGFLHQLESWQAKS